MKAHNKYDTLTFSEAKSGTFSSKASYILRFSYAFLSTILRKVCRSMAHSIPSPPACTVAALGMLYSRANSPKLPVSAQLPTFVSDVAPGGFTNML